MSEAASTICAAPRTRRRVVVFGLLAVFAAGSFFVSLRYGSQRLSPLEVWRALLDHESATLAGRIIWHVRLPRTLAAAMVGICLSLAGAILQGVARNPLAAPNLLGVTSGGGLAAIGIMILFPGYIHLLVPGAFIGALAATLVVTAVAWEHGLRPTRLILAGVAVSSLLGSFTSALMIFYPERVPGVVDFMVGGLAGRSWRHVNIIWPYALGGTVAALLMAKPLNILTLGDETAIGLGLKVERTRLLLIAASSLLAASSVSVAGLLGFVGLIAPHIARLLVGSDHRALFPACVLFSSGLLMSCDTFGRLIIDPIELPAGIIMAALGAPFFLYLLRSKRTGVMR